MVEMVDLVMQQLIVVLMDVMVVTSVLFQLVQELVLDQVVVQVVGYTLKRKVQRVFLEV